MFCGIRCLPGRGVLSPPYQSSQYDKSPPGFDLLKKLFNASAMEANFILSSTTKPSSVYRNGCQNCVSNEAFQLFSSVNQFLRYFYWIYETSRFVYPQYIGSGDLRQHAVFILLSVGGSKQAFYIQNSFRSCVLLIEILASGGFSVLFFPPCFFIGM